jgi:hypothetical protein
MNICDYLWPNVGVPDVATTVSGAEARSGRPKIKNWQRCGNSSENYG